VLVLLFFEASYASRFISDTKRNYLSLSHFKFFCFVSLGVWLLCYYNCSFSFKIINKEIIYIHSQYLLVFSFTNIHVRPYTQHVISSPKRHMAQIFLCMTKKSANCDSDDDVSFSFFTTVFLSKAIKKLVGCAVWISVILIHVSYSEDKCILVNK
jgi:hypothetical protein